jgi:hypothetical protein
MNMDIQQLKHLNEEELKRLSLLITEAKTRGISLEKIKKRDDHWTVDQNGFFVKQNGKLFSPNANQDGFIKSTARFSALISGRGGGKALSIYTEIPTVNGWKTMKDISVRDKVFDENGVPTDVIYISPIMYNHKCYEWKVYQKDIRKYRILDTETLASKFLGIGIQFNYFVDIHEDTESQLKLLYGLADANEHAGKEKWCFDDELLYLKKKEKPVHRKHIYRRGIVYIQPLETVPVKCIKVAADNKLFLAGRSFIPTHNSASGAQKAMRKIMEGKSGAVLNPDF